MYETLSQSTESLKVQNDYHYEKIQELNMRLQQNNMTVRKHNINHWTQENKSKNSKLWKTSVMSLNKKI